MPANLDFDGLAARLLSQAEALLTQWLPGGKKLGKEYICAGLKGGQGRKLSVNLATGLWKDFSGGPGGGDLISLYAAIRGLKNGEAFKELSADTGFTQAEDYTPPPPAPEPLPEVGPPPSEDLLNFEFSHFQHGKPAAYWVYRDETGKALMVVARYETPDGKQVLPWTWHVAENRWTCRGWGWPSTKVPRPLYGLEKLPNHPGKQVLVVEGEKKADAAQKIVGSALVVVAWSGGAQSIKRADWGPLAGRSVVLWPDADLKRLNEDLGGGLKPYLEQPGPGAMQAIAGLLSGKCPVVKVLDVGVDEGRKDGWDAADALEEGWDLAKFLAWAKPRLNTWQWAGPEPEAPVRTIAEMFVHEPGTRPATEEEIEKVKELLKDSEHLIDDANFVPEPSPEPARPAAEVEILPPRGVPEADTTFSPSLFSTWERLQLSCLKNGQPHINLDNVYRFLTNEKSFIDYLWYDEFHEEVFTQFDPKTHERLAKPRPWNDGDELILLNYLQRHVGLTKMPLLTVQQGVALYSRNHVRNEPKEWLKGLVWDKKPRCDHLLTQGFGAEYSEYTTTLSKNWLTSMAARILRPGCQVDTMPVLCGKQGIKKSTSLDALASPWFAELNQKIDSLEFFRALRGKVMVEIAELAAFKRNQIEEIKKMLTTKQDHYRGLWERHTVAHPRRTVFVGTTNAHDFLSDETGARRFWPVECKKANPEWIKENREQLFAEACARFRVWEKSRLDVDGWWLMPGVELKEQHENFRDYDEWENPINEYLEEVSKQIDGMASISDVAHNALGLPAVKIDRIVQLRIGKVLKIAGWRSTVVRNGDSTKRVWKPPTED